ncbi:MAG: aspartyl/asparaginyl beta-hydroxylase domain-containing protein [Arenicella sp.]|nr:aspartyl/asparaginyl beta-hydroxylase domain-containing protein [Arenicella sp.]
MSDSRLLAQADQAFSAGQANQGLTLLRQYNLLNSNDAASWHRQAIIEEQIGDFSAAGKAHFRCIEIAPGNAMGYLYAGYWLQQNNQQIQAIAALYSLAYDLDPSSLALWQHVQVSAPTQLRSREANKVMRHVLSEQHRSVCSSLRNAERIKNAHWVQTSDQPISFGIENFAPELFFIQGLSSKPFYSVEELIWAEQLNTKCSTIKSELTYAMQQQLAKDSLRPYLDKNFSSHSKLGELANSSNWLAIDLFSNGELNTDISSLFPETLDALTALPTYNLNQNPFEVFFSFLKPGQSIAPHFGQSNHALTVHLPLDIPAECYLEVGDEKQSWREGEVLVFDDSFLHSAHNHSDLNRVVLIFSIWHPQLSSDERNAVRQSFIARQTWLSERQSELQRLRAV